MRSSPEQMHATADTVERIADDVWDDIEELRKEVDSLLGGNWVGEAADTHAPVWAEWIESAKTAVGALTDDARLVHHAANEYTKIDKSRAAATAKLDLPEAT